MLAQVSEVRFELGDYDKDLPLVIDPVVIFGSYLGGAGSDEGRAIAIDGSGNTYIAGGLNSIAAFVAKYNSSGVLQYQTNLQSTVGGEIAEDLAVDTSGNPYVCGVSAEADFPQPGGPTVGGLSEDIDYFVTKLVAASGAISYSTFVGGSGSEGFSGEHCSIAVDSSGAAYLAGDTNDATGLGITDGPVAVSGSTDAFVAGLLPSGAADFLHLIGGTGEESAGGIGFNETDSLIYVAGNTSAGFPTVGATVDAYSASGDVFLVALDLVPSIVYATFLGDTGDEEGVRLGSNGPRIAVTGFTDSVNFPVDIGPAPSGSDTFTAFYEIDLFGGFRQRTRVTRAASGVAVDDSGNVLLAGGVTTADVARLNRALAEVDFLSFGVSGLESASDVAFDGANAHVVGSAGGSFPVTDASTFSGVLDAFLAKVAFTLVEDDIILSQDEHIGRMDPSTGSYVEILADDPALLGGNGILGTTGLGIDSDRDLIATTSFSTRLYEYDPDTGVVTELADLATADGIGPLAIEENGDVIIAADTSGLPPSLYRYDESAGTVAEFTDVDISEGGLLRGLAIERDGSILVAVDHAPYHIRRVDPVSGVSAMIPLPVTNLLDQPHGLAIEPDGQIIVANENTDEAIRVDPVTGAQSVVTSDPAIIDPFDVAIEQDGSILLSDDPNEANGAVYRINPTSGLTTLLGPPTLLLGGDPFGVGIIQSIEVMPWTPTLISSSVDRLPLAPGVDQNVTLTGAGFIHTSEVFFDGVELLNVNVTGPTTIDAVVPMGLLGVAGPAPFVIENPAPRDATSAALMVMVGVSAPTLTMINPATATKGDLPFQITLTGTNFTALATVNFDGGALGGFIFDSAMQIRADITAAELDEDGVFPISVTTAGGTSGTVNFTVENPPAFLTSLTPNFVPAGSPDLMVAFGGNDFDDSAVATFDAVDLTTVFGSMNLVTGTIPAAQLAIGGVFGLPSPAGRIPASNQATAAVMVVDGSGFAPDVTDIGVTVDGNEVTVISSSSTRIVASVPLAEAQPGATVIVTNFTTVSSAPVVATVETLSLTSITPSAVTQGAQSVQAVITGQGFDAGSTVDFGGAILTPTANTGSALTVTIPDSLFTAATVIPVAVITSQNVRSGELVFLVNPGLSLTTTLPPATVGEPYTTPLETTGGTGGLIFLAPSGLPDGLAIGPLTGVLFGVATTPGAFFFDIVIVDEGGVFVSQRYELQVIGGLLVPARLSFELGADIEFNEQILALSSVDADPIDYTVESDTDFLIVDPADVSGAVNPGAFATVLVRAIRDGRDPGVYQGSLRVNNVTGGFSTTQTVAVNMTINPSDPVLRPSRTGFTFIGALDGPPPADQTFGVGNRGSGILNWEIEVNTQGSGNWVEIEPGAGMTDPAATVPLVNVSIDPTQVELPGGLARPALYAQVTLTSPDATNSPERMTVVFDLSGSDGAPAATVDPRGLLFRGDAQGEIAPRTVRVSNGSNSPVNFALTLGQTTRVGGGEVGGPGFIVDLNGGAVGGLVAESVEVEVAANSAGLEAGTYVNTLTFEFSNAAGPLPSQQVTLLLIVPETPLAPLLSKQQGVCTPSRLALAFQGPGPGNAVKFGFPQVVRVEASDDCEQPMEEGSISVAFSNGDPQLFLNNLRTGIWEGAWPQTSPTVEPVTLTAFANRRFTEELRIEGRAEVTVNLTENPASPPVILALTNSAGFRESSIAPGMLMSVFGTDLGFEAEVATALPLSETLGGTSIQIGAGFGAMIFGSANQSNVQAPFESTPNTIGPVTIFRDDLAISNRVQTEVKTAEPAVFVDGNTLLSIVTDVNFQLVTPTRPVRPGDVLIAFMSGLGPVEPTVETGFGSPIPVAVVANDVRMLIDEVEVAPLFTGLTPGFVGLYQLNFIVPGGLSSDGPPHLRIVVEVAGEPSPEFRLPFERQ